MNLSQLSVRNELLFLPVAGLLFIAGILLRGQSLDPAVDPAGFASAITAPGAMVAWPLILAGMFCSVYGFWALQMTLQAAPHPHLIRWGTWLSTLGIVTVLPLIGFLALAAPRAGELYLAGHPEAIAVAVAMASRGPGLILAIVSGIVYTAGAVCLALALRGRMPAVLLVALVLQAPLLTFIALYSLIAELVGAVLFLIWGGWLAWQPDAAAVNSSLASRGDHGKSTSMRRGRLLPRANRRS